MRELDTLCPQVLEAVVDELDSIGSMESDIARHVARLVAEAEVIVRWLPVLVDASVKL